MRYAGLTDEPENPVEWIVSVSMLTEGWDVNNVFQIVPHEDRAFNSKLLIAQVLGRGLRVPPAYQNDPKIHPQVTIFNHDAWGPKIDDLVRDVAEISKKICSRVDKESEYNFSVYYIKLKQRQKHRPRAKLNYPNRSDSTAGKI